MSWLLTVFIFLNLFFKFYYLSQESIYGDEAYSIFHAQKSMIELIDIFLHDQNPPLHIALLHFWMKIFGVSDISAKGFSVILSVLCGIILFVFSKKYLNREVTIWVSILFLLSNVQLFYSHEVRTYALVQLLCISSFYYYLKVLKEPSKKAIGMFAFINFLLLFSHYLTVFIHITQFICVWMFYKENKKGVKYYIISQLLVVVVFAPWLKVLFENLPQNGSFWLTAPGFAELKWFVFMINGNEWIFKIFSVIILSSIIMIIFNKRFRFFVELFDNRIYILFLLWYILPIALDFWVAQYTPVFLGRYFLYSTLGLFLLIAYIVGNLNTSYFVRAIIFIPLLWSLILVFDMKPDKEDNWKPIIEKIKQQHNNKTIILISASYKYKDFSFYYDRASFQDYNNTIARLASQNVFCSSDGQWGWNVLHFDKYDQVIFVQSHSQFEDSEGKIRKGLLEKKYKICNELSIVNITATFYKKENMECSPVKIIMHKKASVCDFWETDMGISEQSADTVIIYKTNMEPDSVCPIPHSLVKEKAISGNYSCKINAVDPYSVGLYKTTKELNGMKEISISAFVNCQNESNSRLVVSIEKNSQTLYRQELLVAEEVPAFDVWSRIALSAIIPSDIEQDAELKIYFWNPSNKSAYIDDVQIQLSSGSQ